MFLYPLYTLPQCRDYTLSGLQSEMPVRGSHSLCTRTLDRYTRTGFPECMVNTMSGPPPKTTQDRTHPIPGEKLKFLAPSIIEPGPPGWKAWTLPTTPRRRITPTVFIPRKLQPWFLSLRWKTCPWAELPLGAWVCSEKPAHGQNTQLMIMIPCKWCSIGLLCYSDVWNMFFISFLSLFRNYVC